MTPHKGKDSLLGILFLIALIGIVSLVTVISLWLLGG